MDHWLSWVRCVQNHKIIAKHDEKVIMDGRGLLLVQIFGWPLVFMDPTGTTGQVLVWFSNTGYNFWHPPDTLCLFCAPLCVPTNLFLFLRTHVQQQPLAIVGSSITCSLLNCKKIETWSLWKRSQKRWNNYNSPFHCVLLIFLGICSTRLSTDIRSLNLRPDCSPFPRHQIYKSRRMWLSCSCKLAATWSRPQKTPSMAAAQDNYRLSHLRQAQVGNFDSNLG